MNVMQMGREPLDRVRHNVFHYNLYISVVFKPTAHCLNLQIYKTWHYGTLFSCPLYFFLPNSLLICFIPFANPLAIEKINSINPKHHRSLM